ncbi:MAG: hypothetical protein AAFR17_01020 [Pseudomonadota bacterium]
MSTPAIRDFRPFLGYTPEDWPVARRFYKELGFKENWALDTICEIDTGIGHRFLSAQHIGYDRKIAGMVQFWVESVDDWWAHIEPLKLEDSYPGVKVAAPSITSWDWKMIFIWDPGGWLLHIGHPRDQV